MILFSEKFFDTTVAFVAVVVIVVVMIHLASIALVICVVIVTLVAAVKLHHADCILNIALCNRI